jgi:hypothetical protein
MGADQLVRGEVETVIRTQCPHAGETRAAQHRLVVLDEVLEEHSRPGGAVGAEKLVAQVVQDRLPPRLRCAERVTDQPNRLTGLTAS